MDILLILLSLFILVSIALMLAILATIIYNFIEQERTRRKRRASYLKRKNKVENEN